jgi:SpoVK/Ycf46/Vps4 family AAA+-type ATPase
MRKRKRWHNAIPQDNSTFSDSSMMKSILDYTINLINSIALNENLLTQCFQCIPLKGRNDLVDSIYLTEAIIDDRKKDIYENAVEDIGNPSRLASTIVRDIYKKNCNVKTSALVNQITLHLQKEYKKLNYRNTSFDRRLKELGDIFKLSSADLTLLRLIYLTFSITNDSLNAIFNQINYNEFNRLAAIATGLTPIEIRKSFSKTGLLVSTGIIDNIDHTGSNFVSIDDSIAEFLTGISGKNIVEKYVRLDRKRKHKLGDFSIADEDTSIIKDVLSSGKPCSILLYGIPGTGKTEYARSIASQCSGSIYSVRYGQSETGTRRRNSDSRLIALRVAINSASENGGILIVDEADFLLNTISSYYDSNRPEKGWLNDLLDNSNARIIWITNKIGSMEESTLRRFSYSICFKKFNKNQRISVWNNILKRNPLKKYISSDLVAELSGKYEVNAGAISSSLNALKQINTGRALKQEEIKPLLENLLTKHSILLNADVKKKNKLTELTGKYDLSFLNTDTDINTVVNSVKRFNKTIYNEHGISSINLLLWGESGTGKTEFAKYLASQTGMGLIIKRSSDLMNMYVGETEKLIRNAFKEAEEKKSILFIDEADTFFGSRERAKASWEISHTNEFLVQMENFSGILICCTNLLEIFDTAAMRRFNWKIRFSPVLQKMRIPLYEMYFANEGSSLTPKQKTKIAEIEYLTPGHVKAVHQRRMFADTEIQNHDSIIDEVEKEASYMKVRSPRKMGF